MAFLEIRKDSSSAWVAVKTPSVFEPSHQDISSPDSGRTLDGLMHKNRIGSKKTIALAWNNPTPQEVETIFNLFTQWEYFDLKYWDPSNASTQTVKNFYCGDISAPVKTWLINNKRYSQISFNVIER